MKTCVETAPLVMIVDDDLGSRLSLQAILSSYGYATRIFAGSEELLAETDWPDVACIICDYRMPGMNGLELLPELERRQIGHPVILVSGFANVPVAVTAMRRGAVTVLEKPYRVNTLIQAVQEALSRSIHRTVESAQARDAQRRLLRLSRQEVDVMNQMIAGTSNKVAANRLGISLRTLERRRKLVFSKMGVDSTVKLAEIVRMAQQAPPLETPVPEEPVTGSDFDDDSEPPFDDTPFLG